MAKAASVAKAQRREARAVKIRKGLLAGLLMIATAMAAPPAAEGGSLARSVFRGTMKGATRAFRRGPGQILRRDLLRDRATRVRPLARNRTVFRYTTKKQARQELRRGIRPGSHTTSRAVPGRPPGPGLAQRRYGLPRQPQVRETIHLPKGHPVRLNKALGGRPGTGEITSTKPLSPKAIRKVVPLGRGKR